MSDLQSTRSKNLPIPPKKWSQIQHPMNIWIAFQSPNQILSLLKEQRVALRWQRNPVWSSLMQQNYLHLQCLLSVSHGKNPPKWPWPLSRAGQSVISCSIVEPYVKTCCLFIWYCPTPVKVTLCTFYKNTHKWRDSLSCLPVNMANVLFISVYSLSLLTLRRSSWIQSKKRKEFHLPPKILKNHQFKYR